MDKQSYLHIKKKSDIKAQDDLCKVCESNLYHDENVSKRIGIIEKNGDIDSWKCPHCKSEFDLDDNILYIYGPESISGLA